MMTGTVYKSSGNLYSIKVRNGVEFQCRIKGKLRMEGVKSTNPIAVGDIVEFDVEGNKNSRTGIIKSICDRRNYILRKSVNLSKQTHIIAANIDTLFLVVTLNNPTTSTNFIDRFLFLQMFIQ